MLVILLSLTMLTKTFFSTSDSIPIIIPTSTSNQIMLYQALPSYSHNTPQNQVISASINAKYLPTPEPTTAPVPSSQQLSTLFDTYSTQYHVDKHLLIKIAQCESKLNPNAGTLYKGLFQFSERTWIAWRKRLNADPNPSLRFNAEESIKTAAYMIAQGQISAWPTCSK